MMVEQHCFLCHNSSLMSRPSPHLVLSINRLVLIVSVPVWNMTVEYHFMFIVVGGTASVRPFGTFSHTPLEGSSSVPCQVPFCDVLV